MTWRSEEEREGEREITTIETFDFVEKEVTLSGDANRISFNGGFFKVQQIELVTH